MSLHTTLKSTCIKIRTSTSNYSKYKILLACCLKFVLELIWDFVLGI